MEITWELKKAGNLPVTRTDNRRRGRVGETPSPTEGKGSQRCELLRFSHHFQPTMKTGTVIRAGTGTAIRTGTTTVMVTGIVATSGAGTTKH
jgi:hypothetical protein